MSGALRAVRAVGLAALWLLVLALAALLTPLPSMLGLQLYAVQSGSMEPTLHVGGIVVVAPVHVAEIEPGDIITFAERQRPDIRVTHRVVSVEPRGGEVVVVTRGDANNTSDQPWTAAPADLVGRVRFAMPYAGYVQVWLSTPLGKLAMLALLAAAFLLPAAVRPRRARPNLAAEIAALRQAAPPARTGE